MTFTAPFTAVPGEIITAAGWNTAARDNINHIWGVLGGNPGANDLVPVSTGFSASAWIKVPDSALADQKVSQNPPFIADMAASRAPGFYYATTSSTNGPLTNYFHVISSRYPVDGSYRSDIAVNMLNGSPYIRSFVAGSSTGWVPIWTAGNHGTGSGLVADSVRGYVPGAGASNLAILNGSGQVTAAATAATATTASNVAGKIPGSGSDNLALLDAFGRVLDSQKLDGVDGAGYALVGHGHGAGDAATLDGLDSTAFVRLFAPGVSNSQQIYGQGGSSLTVGFLSGGTFGGSNTTGVGVIGDHKVTGMKGRVATGYDGELGTFHALETPEPVFEDMGRSRLSNGSATVEIAQDFANYVKTGDYDVWITPNGPAALYVPERTSSYFVVKKYSGQDNVQFMWRVTARQCDMDRFARDLPLALQKAA